MYWERAYIRTLEAEQQKKVRKATAEETRKHRKAALESFAKERSAQKERRKTARKARDKAKVDHLKRQQNLVKRWQATVADLSDVNFPPATVKVNNFSCSIRHSTSTRLCACFLFPLIESGEEIPTAQGCTRAQYLEGHARAACRGRSGAGHRKRWEVAFPEAIFLGGGCGTGFVGGGGLRTG